MLSESGCCGVCVRLWRLRRRFVIKKNYVGLHAMSVENACRQTQDRVETRRLKKFAADRFSSAAFKEHIIWNNHCG